MAVPSHAEIMEKVQDGTLIEAIFKRHWDCGPSEHGPFTDMLAEIHNQGHIDLVAGLSPDFLNQYSGQSKWIGQMVYASLLGKLDIPPVLLLDAIERLFDPLHGRNDISKALKTWCRRRRDRIEQVFELVDQSDERCERLHALKAVTSEAVQFEAEHHAERIYAYIAHSNQSYRLQAIEGLRYACFKEEQSWLKTIDVFRTIIEYDRSDDLRALLIDAVFCWFEVAPRAVHAAMEALVAEAVVPLTPAVTTKIAWTLAYNSRYLEQRLWNSLLTVLKGATLDAGDCSNLDYFLEMLINAGGAVCAQDFLQHLLLKDDGKAKHSLSHFQGVVQAVLKGEQAILNAWVIKWLRIGDFRLCDGLGSGLLAGLEEPHQFNFEDTQLTLEFKDYGFIARKAIGYFFHHSVSLATFLASLGGSAPPQQRAEIRDLLFDPVLINYPDLAQGCLAAVANGNDPASRMVREAIELLNDYLEGVRESNPLHELKPSALHRQMEFERHSDQIQQAIDEGRKGAFLADLFHERMLLHGNGVISLVPINGKLRPIETEATLFSHKLELPRQYFFEPISLRMRLFHYKLERHS